MVEHIYGRDIQKISCLGRARPNIILEVETVANYLVWVERILAHFLVQSTVENFFAYSGHFSWSRQQKIILLGSSTFEHIF